MRHVLMMIAFVVSAVPMVAFALTAIGVGGQLATPPVALFDADGYFDGTVECVAHATYDDAKAKCRCDDGYEGIEVELDANERVPKCRLTAANRALYGVLALTPRVDGLEESVALHTTALEALQAQRDEDSALTEIRYAVQAQTNELTSGKILEAQGQIAATNTALAAVVARVDAVETGLGTVQTDVDAVEADVVVVKADVVDLKDRPVALFGFRVGGLLGLHSSPTVEISEGEDELVRFIGHPAVTIGLYGGSLRHDRGVTGSFDIGFGPSKGSYNDAGEHDIGSEMLMRFGLDYTFRLGAEQRSLAMVGPMMHLAFSDVDLFEDESISVGALWGAGFTWIPPSDGPVGLGLGFDLGLGLVNYNYQPRSNDPVQDCTDFALGANFRIVMVLDPGL